MIEARDPGLEQSIPNTFIELKRDTEVDSLRICSVLLADLRNECCREDPRSCSAKSSVARGQVRLSKAIVPLRPDLARRLTCSPI